MGKKVLRPGGRELTERLIENLEISTDDRVVEFAPGLGFTAAISLKKNPASYTGVELNDEAAGILRKKIKGSNRNIIIGKAEESNLEENSYTKVYGEAMLTMQPDKKKSEIIREAHRILKPGGLYGIHELGLITEKVTEDLKLEIQKGLANVIKVNARPLTIEEWTTLMENEGFEIAYTTTNPFHLLETGRIVKDEGLIRAIKIAFNIFTHKPERQRILAMKRVFKKYESQMNAVAIIARKKG